MAETFDYEDQQLRDLTREYLDFLDDDADQAVYSRLVKEMIQNAEIRLVININDLRLKKPERARALLQTATSTLEVMCAERALRELIHSINPTHLINNVGLEFFVGFEGSFGNRHVTPRTLKSIMLNSVVCLEGIVTKASLIRPKVVRSVHYCPATRKTMERKYTDMTSYDPFPSGSSYPTRDDDGNLLETEYGLSTYKDHQTFTIQELPEKAPPGQLPRSMDVIADNDLVDACKPGDRVQIVGTYRCMPSKQGYYSSATFKTVILANHVRLMSKEVAPFISEEDVKNCRKFARGRHDVFEVLSQSLAPSIHGHAYVKRALLCMLLGGTEKVLPNGTRLRGDINVLLIGDPSVAKSQLLRYVLYTAPRAVTTTGRGSSGVGLTAAVTVDGETGERRLEAGAMVLADRGVVCIDEFDKMSDIDRTAIHEVMEQGRVTICKAGIAAKLNARCSVLAAANPIYGRYDRYKTPMDNIAMQDSLLSRFDLLFIMLDENNPELDETIADHVVRMHRYRAPGEREGEVTRIITDAEFLTTRDDKEEDEHVETQIYEKLDPLLHGPRRSQKIVTIPFMKKYIHIAKTMRPSLTQEACDVIAEEYANLRSVDLDKSDMAKTQPVTARTLETLIRLSTAHAKARLSTEVTEDDAIAAVKLVQFAIFAKVMTKKKSRRASEGEDGDEEEEEEDEIDEQMEQDMAAGGEPAEKKKRSQDPYEYDEEGEEDEEAGRKKKKTRRSKTTVTEADRDDGAVEEAEEVARVEVSETRLKEFKQALFQEFRRTQAQSLPLEDIEKNLTSGKGKFTKPEILSCLDKMQEANHIMLSEDVVFLI